ncbi:MAG: cytochrome P460 family protein [Miltoncostaeaceae bacterium]
MTRVRTLAGLAAVALVALTGAACGSGDDGDSGEAPATTPTVAEDTGPATTGEPPQTAPEPEPEPEPPTTAPATTRPAPTPPPRPRALPGLPAYTAGFQRWLRLNAEPIPPNSADSQQVGFDAHLSTKQVYVNRTRQQITGTGGAQRRPDPDGTILLTTGSTGDTITLIAVMRKIAGSDPAHGDWQFIEWKRDSADQSFATDASLQDATCWSCHGLVEEDDWVFTGLE